MSYVYYHDIRLKYPAKFDNPTNINTFQLLLSSVDESAQI